MAESNSELLTVEAALAELRGLFPKSRGSVSVRSYRGGYFGVMEFDYEPKMHVHLNKTEVEIWLMDVKPANSELGIKMRGATLDEAMQQVRDWHKETQK